MQRILIAVITVLSSSLLTGCAGPMTPFGSVGFFSSSAVLKSQRDPAAERARIRFDPSAQVLHGSSSFSVIIEDPQGVPRNHRIALIYNGIDVSQQFTTHAEATFLDSEHKQLRMTTKRLRILETRENAIQAIYWRIPNVAPVIATYNPPKCSAFELSKPMRKLRGFNPSGSLIGAINQNALGKNLNPFYVAGLIAQESAFNPQTLSRMRAIGLTQITPISESELMSTVHAWPRYPGLDDLSWPLLKYSIMQRTINETNEWRLNPELSVQGGVAYLEYLQSYWSRSDKKALLDLNFASSEFALSEVILASYSSGAARVSLAIERRGSEWLQDSELSEARKYVRRVVSYCNYFSDSGE